MEEEWFPLPHIARTLGIADSTARRWAGLWPAWVKTQGHGSGRRVHRDTQEIFARVQTLYDHGSTTEQITERLRREFPATIEVVAVPEPPSTPPEAALWALAESLQTALRDMETRLTTQMADSQTEVIQLKAEIVALRKQQELAEDAGRHDAAEHDRELIARIRLAVQTTIEERTRQDHRHWWTLWTSRRD